MILPWPEKPKVGNLLKERSVSQQKRLLDVYDVKLPEKQRSAESVENPQSAELVEELKRDNFTTEFECSKKHIQQWMCFLFLKLKKLKPWNTSMFFDKITT